MRLAAAIPILLTLSASSAWLAQQQQQTPFPHERHARLFPFCEGCHVGLPAGDSASFYPSAALCERCHDGAPTARVIWRGPTREIDNLRFNHATHFAASGRTGAPVECETCHSGQSDNRMNVARAPVATCLGCHAHQATAHLTDARCGTCHVALAETQFDTARILRLPIPPNHTSASFLQDGHGQAADAQGANCSVCHTRERCTSCHVNAASVRAIGALPPARAGMTLPRWAAHYPEPASHASASWIDQHGASATARSCSTCHTREDCETCHRASQPKVIAELARRRDVSAPGVVKLTLAAPLTHAAPGFARAHGTQAATNRTSCTTCHARESCALCHERTALADVRMNGAPALPAMRAPRDTVGRVSRAANPSSRFHPPTFMLRHSSSAYSRRLECANCHDVRVFCRDCHTQSGLSTATASTRLRGSFHDAEPLWLLRHARAARQGLESCTACHSQRDCLQCHSQIGLFGVNPHGDDFDARRAQKRNAVICFACHLADPLGG